MNAEETTLTLEYWEDEGWLVGRLVEVPGVVSQGADLEELEENIRDAYQLVMTDRPPQSARGATRKRIAIPA